MADKYRAVTFVLRQLRTASVMFTKTDDPNDNVWMVCPRSCLHGGDDLKLSRIQSYSLPLQVTVRMFEWKADQLQLA